MLMLMHTHICIKTASCNKEIEQQNSWFKNFTFFYTFNVAAKNQIFTPRFNVSAKSMILIHRFTAKTMKNKAIYSSYTVSLSMVFSWTYCTLHVCRYKLQGTYRKAFEDHPEVAGPKYMALIGHSPSAACIHHRDPVCLVSSPHLQTAYFPGIRLS